MTNTQNKTATHTPGPVIRPGESIAAIVTFLIVFYFAIWTLSQ